MWQRSCGSARRLEAVASDALAAMLAAAEGSGVSGRHPKRPMCCAGGDPGSSLAGKVIEAPPYLPPAVVKESIADLFVEDRPERGSCACLGWAVDCGRDQRR